MKSIQIISILCLVCAISIAHGRKCNTVNCFVAPCSVSSCPAYPYAVCKDNYCGGCFADYYVNGRKVNCKRHRRCAGTIVECLVAPCNQASCPLHPNATCYDNYCDGCNADFYENGVKVDCGYESIVS